MNENAKLWVEVLEKGELPDGRPIEQATGQLRLGSDDSFCCLGVACELFRQQTGKGEWTEDGYFDCSAIDSAESNRRWDVLPDVVKEWLGLYEINGEIPGDSPLSERNDRGKSFKEIARVIADEPEGLFEKK